MPIQITYTGTISTGTISQAGFDRPAGAVSMTRVAEGSGTRIDVADYSYGATLQVDLGGAGLPGILSTDWHSAANRVALSVSGYGNASLARPVIDTARAAWEAGTHDGQLAYLRPGALQADAATVLATQVNGQALLFVAPMDGAGITAFSLSATGTPGGARVQADGAAQYLDHVADMAVIETAQGAFLYAGSSSEHGVSGYRIGAGGALSAVDHLGRGESLPVQTITALDTAEVAGRDFLIVAAAGSSSLTVLEVAADGTLSVADHLMDSLDTRFAGVTQLDVITIDGHVFVVAAGRDAGISLFALSPDGHLVHLDTISDTLATALNGVSGLAIQAVPGGFEIVTTATADAGLSLFRVDFNGSGLVQSRASGTLNGTSGSDMLALETGNGTIFAGAGDDILNDGAGRDVLSGGDGADIFVLGADGQRDVITDIRPGQDVLDLSDWGFLYSVDQIAIESTSAGAILRFGGEELELRSFDGRTLTRADVARLLPEMLSRIAVTTGPMLQAEAPADTDPFPGQTPTPTPTPTGTPGRVLTGGAGADSLTGTAGKDSIDGGAGNDTLRGGDGDDGIKGRDGDDLIYGGAGNDRLPGEGGNDRIYGEDGNDRLGGGDGNDLMDGGAGNDRGGSGHGEDTIRGGAGNDWFSGGAGNDLVEGEDGNDRLAGSYGNDTVSGGAGDDTMGGGNGTDIMGGGAGNDVIGAGDHNDTVWGNEGDDFLGGGDGDDVLRGNEGNDTLNGGYGNDMLYGGSGSDVFVFNAQSGGGTDVIHDFDQGADLLRLVGRPLGNDPLARLDLTDTTFEGAAAVQIRYGDHTILVLGAEVSDLGADDFLFV